MFNSMGEMTNETSLGSLSIGDVSTEKEVTHEGKICKDMNTLNNNKRCIAKLWFFTVLAFMLCFPGVGFIMRSDAAVFFVAGGSVFFGMMAYGAYVMAKYTWTEHRHRISNPWSPTGGHRRCI